MSVGIKQAVNQVRLTNVAYVRLTRKGKKFEIACYRNKVANWRNKIENSIEEVLQIDTVFTNVSKGMLASSKDLMEAFGTTDHLTVCKEILDKGDVQVSEQERGLFLENMFRDVASIVVEKSINPENNRPYTINIIQNAMKQIHYSVNATRSAKSQALDVIRRLKEVMPIARASMALRIVCSPENYDNVRSILSKETGIVITAQEQSATVSAALPEPGSVDTTGTTSNSGSTAVNRSSYIDILADPEVYKRLEQLLAKHIGESCRVDVMQLRVASAATSSTTSSASASAGHNSMDTAEDGGASVVDRKLFDQLSPILEANAEFANSDDEEDGSGDDEEVFGLAEKSSRKKLKKQQKKLQKHAEETESGLTSDSINLELNDTAGAPKNASGSGASNESKGDGNKKGKKAKRAEKEEKLEREIRQQKLRERSEKEMGKAAEAMSITDSTIPSSSSSASSLPPPSSSSSSSQPAASESASVPAGAKSCNTCSGVFADPVSYRNHFKSEWHVHNLKRKMKKMPVITSEEEFLKLPFEERDI